MVHLSAKGSHVRAASAEALPFVLSPLNRDDRGPSFLSALAVLSLQVYFDFNPEGYPENFSGLTAVVKKTFGPFKTVHDIGRTDFLASWFTSEESNQRLFIVKGTGSKNDLMSHNLWMLTQRWNSSMVFKAFEHFVSLAKEEKDPRAAFVLSGHSMGGHVALSLMPMLFAKEPELFKRCHLVAFDPPGAREGMDACLADLLPGETSRHRDFYAALRHQSDIVVGHPSLVNRLNKQPLPVWCLAEAYAVGLRDCARMTGDEIWERRNDDSAPGDPSEAHSLGNIALELQRLGQEVRDKGKQWTTKAQEWGEGHIINKARDVLPSFPKENLRAWQRGLVQVMGLFQVRALWQRVGDQIPLDGLAAQRIMLRAWNAPSARLDATQREIEEEAMLIQGNVHRWLAKRQFAPGQFGTLTEGLAEVLPRKQGLVTSGLQQPIHGSSRIAWQTPKWVERSKRGVSLSLCAGAVFTLACHSELLIPNTVILLLCVTVLLATTGFFAWTGFSQNGENFLMFMAPHQFERVPAPRKEPEASVSPDVVPLVRPGPA